MKIYNNILDFDKDIPLGLVLGTFDGVHRGHRRLLSDFIKFSKEKKLETVILTFNPHPREIISNKNFKLINTLSERIYILKEQGIDNIIIQKFDEKFSEIKYYDFIENLLLKKLNIKLIIFGYDNHFGNNREGNINSLKELQNTYNFDLKQLGVLKDNDINISSTKIRNLIQEGNISKANHYLGYNFFINGIVVNGNKIGSKIGFPTANLFIEETKKIIPKNGVYSVNVKLNNTTYKAISNIGIKPTIGENNNVSVEIHIFNFNQNIYDTKICVEFLDRIRDEKKFNSLEDLKKQIFDDIETIKNQNY